MCTLAILRYSQFSQSVVSNSLQTHGLQHAKPPCPSPTPRTYSNSYPLSQWLHLIFCRPLLPLPSIFPSIRVFSNESVLHSRWLQFSTRSSYEYIGPISFRMDWLDLLAVQGTLKSLLQPTVQKHQFFGAQLYSPNLTSIYDYWKNPNFD